MHHLYTTSKIISAMHQREIPTDNMPYWCLMTAHGNIQVTVRHKQSGQRLGYVFSPCLGDVCSHIRLELCQNRWLAQNRDEEDWLCDIWSTSRYQISEARLKPRRLLRDIDIPGASCSVAAPKKRAHLTRFACSDELMYRESGIICSPQRSYYDIRPSIRGPVAYLKWLLMR